MTVVLDKSATLAGTDDGNGNGGANFRHIVKAAVLGAATGTQMRVTLLFGTAETTETPAIDDMWVGQAAASGNAYDFNGNQVQLKFSGGNSINGAAAGAVVSDWVTLGEAYDSSKNYVFAFHPKSGANCNISFAAIANCDQYFPTAGNTSTSASTVPADVFGVNAGALSLIEKIEIQAAGGGGIPTSPTLPMMGI